jgi:hypothetical protein
MVHGERVADVGAYFRVLWRRELRRGEGGWLRGMDRVLDRIGRRFTGAWLMPCCPSAYAVYVVPLRPASELPLEPAGLAPSRDARCVHQTLRPTAALGFRGMASRSLRPSRIRSQAFHMPGILPPASDGRATAMRQTRTGVRQISDQCNQHNIPTMPLVQANQKPSPGPSPRSSMHHLRIELTTEFSRLRVSSNFSVKVARLAIRGFP